MTKRVLFIFNKKRIVFAIFMRGPSDEKVLVNTGISRVSWKKIRDRFESFRFGSGDTRLPNNYTNVAYGFLMKIFPLEMASKHRHTDDYERLGFFAFILPSQSQKQSIF